MPENMLMRPKGGGGDRRYYPVQLQTSPPLNPPVNGGKLTLPVYGEGRGGASGAKL